MILIIFLVCFLGGLVFMLVELRNAPVARQDESGFHVTETKPQSDLDTRVGGNSQQSSFVAPEQDHEDHEGLIQARKF